MCLRMAMTYHSRGALAAAPIVLTAWAFLLIGRLPPRGRWLLGIVAVASCVAYFALMDSGRVAVFDQTLPPMAGAWLPNLASSSRQSFCSGSLPRTPNDEPRTANARTEPEHEPRTETEKREPALPLPPHPIEAEWPRPRRGEVKPQEAVQDRDLAAVLPPPDAVAALSRATRSRRPPSRRTR